MPPARVRPVARFPFPASPSLILLGAAFLALAAPLPGQQEGVGWDIEAEVSGSLFFGNTRQTLVTTRSRFSHADSTDRFSLGGRFTYGESSDEDDDPFVSKRSWNGSFNYDLLPFARWSYFLLGTAESSLEKRIDFRYNAGAGSKLTFVRTGTSLADISLALLGERTYFPSALPDDDEALVRWSARGRYSREVNDRVRVSHETFYRPVVDAFDRFTITSTTSVAIRLARFANLSVSFLDNYDSEAKDRGARSNNDGQLVLGVLASF